MYIYDDMQTNILYNLDAFHELKVQMLYCNARNQHYYDSPSSNGAYTLSLTVIQDSGNNSTFGNTTELYSQNTALGPTFTTAGEANRLYHAILRKIHSGERMVYLSEEMRALGYSVGLNVMK